MCGACVYIYVSEGKFFCKLDRNVCIKECWSVFLNACLPTFPIMIVVKFTSFDWSLTLPFCPSSSSVCRQVSLAVREKEEIQVFQGPLEWREHQDYRASLEAQGLQDPLDLQDQELERESQDFQGEKVECCFFFFKLKDTLFLTPADCLTVSIRRERLWGSEGFPWSARPSWIPRIPRREGRSWRPWKKWTPWWSRIPWTERLSINHRPTTTSDSNPLA